VSDFYGASAATANVTYIGQAGENNGTSFYSFNLSTIPPGLVVIVVHNEDSASDGGTEPLSVVVGVGGTSAQLAVAATSTGAPVGIAHVSIWYAVIPGSTTVVSVEYSGNPPLRCGIGVYSIQDYSSSTPVFTDSVTDTALVNTRAINTPVINPGAIIAGHTSGDIYSHSWGGTLVENYDERVGGNGLTGMTGASYTTPTSNSYTISTTYASPSQGTALVAAAWN
jgi:hypothetical protein